MSACLSSPISGIAGVILSVTPVQLISGSKTIQGWAARTPADSEDTLRFAEQTGVRAMVETHGLEQADPGLRAHDER